MQSSWEDALEVVVGFLEAPPEPDTMEGRRFDAALLRVLAGGPDPADGPEPEKPTLDPGLRERLDALVQRRAARNPFGDHPDGIGPTLGMNLGQS